MPKVAILGGGVGGMTAAFELTATPELRERYDVTLYQLGWRLGGKGASGRNASAHDRIEEHGLHVWFGFYDNAFRLMRDAYSELGRAPGTPLATFEEAFKGCDQLVLYDPQDGGWHGQRIDCPRNPLRPGDSGELPTFWEIAATSCRWALAGWRALRDDRDDLPPAEHDDDGFLPDWFENLAADLGRELLELPLDLGERLLGLAERLASRRAGGTDHALALQATHPALLIKLLKAFRAWLWTTVAAPRCERDPELRFFFTTVDAGVATLAGIVEDGVLEHGFDVINDEDWATWLRRHGASELTVGREPAVRSPALRSVYDVAFAYVGGQIPRADCAAGTATNDLLRLAFSYRGSIMYKMQAGMGDVVFTPVYEVLRERGVRFEFFSAVQRLGLAPDAARVDEIEIARQAELAPGLDSYDPLVDVKGLPCWPSEPRWEQLRDGARLAAEAPDFERALNPLGGPVRTLRHGTDFDEVVLAIPVGALGDLCGELIERDERFRRGIETAATVQTQAFQLWSDRSAEELGWEHDENSVAGCYVEPLDTYCDMTHLIERESWNEPGGARTIGYFCGVIDDREGESPEATVERARGDAVEFIERDLGTLWPGAVRGGAFDWDVLIDPEGRSGPERFAAQYSRANVAGWERYVLTPAGSVEHRLPSGDSGFENLFLAGDWTSNGIDGGCVEAAVISGMDAARALSGSRLPIPGASTSWIRPGEPGAAGLRGVRRPRHRARALLLRGRPPHRTAARGRRRAHRRAGGAHVQRARRQRGPVPRAGRAGAAAGGKLRPRDLAHAALRPLGRGARDPGLVLDPGAGRPRPGRAVPGRARAARRALHLRGQPDVLPGRARGLRVRQDDGPLQPRERAGRGGVAAGLRGQLRPRRGRGLARLPRARGARAARRAERGPARRPARAAAPPRG